MGRSRGVPELIDGPAARHLMANRAFDTNRLRAALSVRLRHLIQNAFGKLKENSGIAIRS